MTTISARKPKRNFWQTGCVANWKGGDRRMVCVALEPAAMVLRLKGTRRAFRLPWSTAYDLAVLAEVRAAEKSKRDAKKQAGGKPRARAVARGRI